jgi:hypothetical protein
MNIDATSNGLTNPELHRFVTRLIGVVAITLVPVVFTTFMSMPLSLNRHPGEAAPTGTALPRHMT